MNSDLKLLAVFLLLSAAGIACKTPLRSPSSEQKSAHSQKAGIDSVSELRDVLLRARPGEIIILAKSAEFDLSNERALEIPAGVTIEGNGSHFFSHTAPLPLIKTLGANVTLRNLRIEGPEKETREVEIRELMKTKGSKATYSFPIVRGIEANHTGFLIEDSELWGWSHSAIQVGDRATAVVRNNKIHHNQRTSLGYGVVLVGNSSALITHNEFDYNRHSIAGTGSPGQSYEASYNTFGLHHTQSTLDMHGGQDRKDGTHIAGHLVNVHHNTILAGQVEAFLFRGVPEEKVIFKDNRLAHESINEAVKFPSSYGFHFWNIPRDKFESSGNLFRYKP